MNCKPGDVALVNKGQWPNVGKIVLVRHDYGEVDYSSMGYGVLPSWFVQTLGGDLDTVQGPPKRGFTPDISLCPLPGITSEIGQEMMIKKALADLDAAALDLVEIIRRHEEAEEAKREAREVVVQD